MADRPVILIDLDALGDDAEGRLRRLADIQSAIHGYLPYENYALVNFKDGEYDLVIPAMIEFGGEHGRD